jgi:CubicO group peptidase (beta-lactamase class C family)
VRALEQVARWPVGTAAVAVVDAGGVRAAVGPDDARLHWASVTKLVSSLACWVAVEEGTLAFDRPAGPPGATVAHLLAHASGLDFASDAVLAAPGTRRNYSKRGFEVLAEELARSGGMPFVEYAAAGVLDPLGMSGTSFDDDPSAPAAGLTGDLRDLVRLAGELLAPRLVSPATLRTVTAVAFPGLDGVLPGFGRQSPNDWGLGIELRGSKRPHWTAPGADPRTFGHFGRSGGFVWVDPVANLACCCLTDRPFGPWAAEAWPALGAAVLAEAGAG